MRTSGRSRNRQSGEVRVNPRAFERYPRTMLRALFLSAVLTHLCAACDRTPDEVAYRDIMTTERSSPPFPVEEPGDDLCRVVFLGDSITAGLHLSSELAFPAVVQRLCTEAGAPFHLTNAGISGDTSAGGLRRIDWLLKQDPDLVVVELGGNDGLRGQPLEEIEKNLRELVTRIQAHGSRVLLCGMRIPTNYGDEYAEGFAQLYERLASELETGFVPFFMEGVAGHPEWNLEDELHPNAGGHERLARRLLPQVKSSVEALTNAPPRTK